MIRTLTMLALGASAVGLSAAAGATTYTGSQQVGTISATYSITTDGTPGALAFGNITGYSVTFSTPGASDFTFDRTAGGGDSFSGDVNATAAGLSVPFIDSFQLYSVDGTGAYTALLNFTTFGTRAQFNGGAQQSNTVNNTSTPFATAAAPAAGVPEPATWGTMVLGAGLLGLAMRRRRADVRFA